MPGAVNVNRSTINVELPCLLPEPYGGQGVIPAFAPGYRASTPDQAPSLWRPKAAPQGASRPAQVPGIILNHSPASSLCMPAHPALPFFPTATMSPHTISLAHRQTTELLYHADAQDHAGQYADWQSDGDDIVFSSRTASDDGLGGARSAHDANYLRYHRTMAIRLGQTPVRAGVGLSQ